MSCIFDSGYLDLEYQRIIVASLAFLASMSNAPSSVSSWSSSSSSVFPRILVISLGGGSLAMFLHDYLPKSVIDVVELGTQCLTDPASDYRHRGGSG